MSRQRSRRARIAKATPKPVSEKIKQQIAILLGDDPPVPKDDDVSEQTANPPLDAIKVTLMKDHGLEYPDLFMSIYVESSSRYEKAQFAEMFVRARCQRAETPDDADLVIFTGGVDVNPALYGEVAHHRTDSASEERDTADINLYLFCLERGIPMAGVCRGAQFLHVMNGGKLYQHVDRHNGDHPMFDVVDKVMLERVSSVHHQMVVPNIEGGMIVLGTSARASERWLNPMDCVRGNRSDVEAFFYRDTCCLGVQGHPEYRGYNFFAKWFLKTIEGYIMNSADISAAGTGKYRVLPDILAQRGLGKFANPEVAVPAQGVETH